MKTLERTLKKPVSYLLKINLALSILAAIVYLMPFFSPAIFWPAGMLAMSIPLILFCQTIFPIYWLIKKKDNAIIPLITLVIGWPFLFATFSFKLQDKATGPIHILSYNVGTFNSSYKYMMDFGGPKNSKNLVKWVQNHPADILCLQEYYNDDDSKDFNTLERLTKSGKLNYFMLPVHNPRSSKGFYSVATFSRFPIINKGEVKTEGQDILNRVIYTDLKIKQDTVRIYNVHLQSMQINQESLFDLNSFSKFKKNYKQVLKKIKSGVAIRGKQADVLYEHVSQSPYPVILCGDINDMPYSYTYSRIKGALSNSFEEKGSGFGFTFNGSLFFLRIDNQFFGKGIKINTLKTHREAKFTEHLPISGSYTVE